jgi:nitrogen regulatory protein P-II 1
LDANSSTFRREKARKEQIVKMIVAVVNAFAFEKVRSALKENGFPGMTVYRVDGYGRQPSFMPQYRGHELDDDRHPKVQIVIAVEDQDLAFVRDTIVHIAHTGKSGDGRVWVLPLEQHINIRTRNSEAAVSEGLTTM